MPGSLETSREQSLLLLGASRGLGYAIAESYLELGWRVVATARRESGAKLRKLVATVNAQGGKPGLQYLDYLGRTGPW